ncbi:EG45-like domain containing protein [Linum grandiflorum]
MAAATGLIINTSSLPLLAAFFLAISLSFTSLASAAGNGTASSYRPDASSACKTHNGSASIGQELVAMVPKTVFNNGAACGRMYKISCIGAIDEYPKEPCKLNQSVTVTVANECGGDDCATFTLSTDAFALIAKPEAGRVQISYRRYHKGQKAIHPR